jgi:hypothetical protein
MLLFDFAKGRNPNTPAAITKASRADRIHVRKPFFLIDDKLER